MPHRRPSGPTEFAARLRARREELQLTQKEAAGRIGVSQDVLSRIERGVYVGTERTIRSAARVLDLDADDLCRLADDARDGVAIAISKCDRLTDECKRDLLRKYHELLGDSSQIPDEEQLLVGMKAAAIMLSVSPRTVAKLAADGDVTLVHIRPQLPRITVESIRELIERRSS